MDCFNEDKAVARLAGIVALQCGAAPAEAKLICTAAVLHDVGKRQIPAAILNKPGKLTEREFEVMKTHTLLGAGMLTTMQGGLGKMARLIAQFHHERYDGQGYWGKPMHELPYYLQFVTIADVFTALVSERPYKQAWPPRDALGYIQGQSGALFSPALVDIFTPLARNDGRVKALFGKGAA
jgi:response regulator RpfG family c-di-GMP phosphodiesterase